MSLTAQHPLEATRQFLAAMDAQVKGQRTIQSMLGTPELAITAQANLDLPTVLELLRD
jgi:hypothetical protein